MVQQIVLGGYAEHFCFHFMHKLHRWKDVNLININKIFPQRFIRKLFQLPNFTGYNTLFGTTYS